MSDQDSRPERMSDTQRMSDEPMLDRMSDDALASMATSAVHDQQHRDAGAGELLRRLRFMAETSSRQGGEIEDLERRLAERTEELGDRKMVEIAADMAMTRAVSPGELLHLLQMAVGLRDKLRELEAALEDPAFVRVPRSVLERIANPKTPDSYRTPSEMLAKRLLREYGCGV